MKLSCELLPRTCAAILFTAACLLTAGCGRLGNQNAAIEKAIKDHLGERSDLSMDKMVMEVQQVAVTGDKAQAEVVFRTTSDPPARMAYHYELHRDGGRWMVDSGRPGAAQTQHPQLGESAPGPGDADTGDLPPGHPPISQTPADQGNPHGGEPPPSQAHP